MQYHLNRQQFRIVSRYCAIENFDGACDPAFDNDYEELERQFAELRISQTRDLN